MLFDQLILEADVKFEFQAFGSPGLQWLLFCSPVVRIFNDLVSSWELDDGLDGPDKLKTALLNVRLIDILKNHVVNEAILGWLDATETYGCQDCH